MDPSTLCPTFVGRNATCVGRFDHERLCSVAEMYAGYLSTEQALAPGMDRSTSTRPAREGGRYVLVRRDVYRLRHFPISEHEHVMAVQSPLRVGKALATSSGRTVRRGGGGI